VPPQEQAHINLAEEFDRYHFIVGTFERALSTLEKYSPSDFPSQHLYAYVIGALRKNSLYYEEVLNGTIDGEEKKTAAAADDDDDDDDENDDDENDSHLFYEAGRNDDDDDDDDALCRRHALRAIRRRRDSRRSDEEEDRFQMHYVRIFELAKKYGVHGL
jgi:hypothetical protein